MTDTLQVLYRGQVILLSQLTLLLCEKTTGMQKIILTPYRIKRYAARDD